MSKSFSIGHRSPSLNGLFAGLACAITLTLTAGPALAGPAHELARVEVQGRMVEAPVRYDVRAGCAGIEAQLQESLQLAWMRATRFGAVKVQLVMQDNEVADVSAKGISNEVAREVRRAVNRLDCGNSATTAAAGAQVYRFSVDFIDPSSRPADLRTAGGQPGVRVALARD